MCESVKAIVEEKKPVPEKKPYSRAIYFRVWDSKKKKYITNYQRTVHLFTPYNGLYNTFDSDDGFVYQEYTGITDKNGIGIYEGDVIEVDEFKVKQQFFIHDLRFIPDRFFWKSSKNKMKIIGNVNETPEMCAKFSK